MSRHLSYLVLATIGMPMPVLCCDCQAPKPACAYLEADAIFLGRVSFTNDDGSGRLTQATLVRFDVEERFKGIAAEVRQVWADPGSFTSCYEVYRLGQRYLIFATRNTEFPTDTTATTIMRDGEGKSKPLPPGFDPTKPPPVYYAPECAGSRTADYPSLGNDLAMLRAYRGGATLPRVLGNVYLYPFRGWPVLSGPPLKGAKVTMSSGAVTLSATTDAKGEFSLANAPAGYYSTWADLSPYRMVRPAILHVPEIGCGYTDLRLTTTSTLPGIVLDDRGRPAPNIPVRIRLTATESEDGIDHYALRATTDRNGQFIISGLPDADVYLSAGSDYPDTEMPYRRVYYRTGRSPESAAVLRLKPGEHRLPIVLWLEAPLDKASVRVRVVHKQGGPAVNAAVKAFNDNRDIPESATTEAHGVAEVPCLRGLKYEMEAQTVRRSPSRGNILKSQRVPFICGDSSAVLELVLDHSARF